MDSQTVTDARSRLSQDFHRPHYHYLPPENWMNDPNGVIQWGGRYHLFFQYNPIGANHANMHWGHAVSEDLIHWEDMPVAITPTPHSADEGGIFSGCIVDHSGVPTAFYTGVNPDYSIQTQCLATSHDGMITWQKYEANPVVGEVPAELHQTNDFRDPFVWQQDDAWYMVVGTRIEGVGGAVTLHRSRNLHDWEYLRTLFEGNLAIHGVMWECPNFFRLGDKWVLIISSHIGYATGTMLYFVGTYDDYRFTPEYEGVLDSGYYYAGLSCENDKGQRLMWAWIREGRSEEAHVSAGWAGVQAIPRVLTLDDKNRLVMTPTENLSQLYSQTHQFTAADCSDDENLPVSGAALDMHLCFTIEGNTPCGIRLSSAASSNEYTNILYQPSTKTLIIQRNYGDIHTTDIDTFQQGVVHHLDEGETLDLRILLDASVLEVIANKRSSVTTRIYPTQSGVQNLRVINSETLTALTIHEMVSIW